MDDEIIQVEDIEEVLPAETIQTTETERPFLTTPLNDYTVSEGLLLVLVLLVILSAVAKLWREIF